MKVIDPVAVTAAALTSSTVAETDYPAWSNTTSYAAGDRVVGLHRVYESLRSANKGRNPSAGDPTYWLDIGPTNRWAMFDIAAGPVTTAAGTVAVVLSPATAIGAVALVDIVADAVRVQVTADGDTVYDKTQATADATSAAFLDLPAEAGQLITITVAVDGGDVAIGKLVIGTAVDLGQTETAPTVSLIDYSQRQTDDFGVTTIVERSWSKQLTLRVRLSSDDADEVDRRLAALRAVPTIWIGEDGFESLTAYGFVKDFSLDLQLGATTYCSLTVEGMPSADIGTASGDPAVDGVSDLRAIDPMPVTDAALASSSVAEDDYPEWSAATTYAAGDRIIVAAAHRVYESLIDSNLDGDPSDVSKWLDVGPTNRWAMFDQALGTATTGAGSVVVSLHALEAVAGLAVLNTVGASVRVQAPGYDHIAAIGGDATTFLDLTVAAGAAITVTVAAEDPEEIVAVGTLLFGSIVPLGVIETSPSVGITDYSKKDTDAFGNTNLVERAWAKRMAVKSMVATTAVDALLRSVALLRARPVLWIGQDDLSSLTIYGFFKDFSVELSEATSICSVTIEGLSLAAQLPKPPVVVRMQTFRQAAAPSAAESNLGDLWFDTSNGNKVYIRLAGDGVLALPDGSAVTLPNGTTISIPVWIATDDQRFGSIAEELAAALGEIARIQSDGWLSRSEKPDLIVDVAAIAAEYPILSAKATAQGVESTTYAAKHSALLAYLGTLSGWNDTTTDTAIPDTAAFSAAFDDYYEARAALQSALADLTSANQHTIPAIADVHVPADYTGTIADGALPVERFVQHLIGTVDHSGSATVEASASSGVAITVNNTADDDARGTITITEQDLPPTSTISGTSTFAGVGLPFSFALFRDDAAPPATGGGGSDGGGGGDATPGSPASSSSFTGVAVSTMVTLTTLPAVTVGASGEIKLTAPLGFTVGSQGTLMEGDDPNDVYMACIWQYSTDGGTTWTDAGTAITATVPAQCYFTITSPKGLKSYPGSIHVSQTIDGLSAGASVLCRLQGRKVNAQPIQSVFGTATATPQ